MIFLPTVYLVIFDMHQQYETTDKGKDKVDKLSLLFVRSQMRKIL
jgi:hypothetical protein